MRRLVSKLRQSGPLGRLVCDSITANGHLYAIAVVAMVAVAGTTAGSAYVMEYIVEVMTRPDMRGWSSLIALSVIFLFLVKAVATYLQALTMARAGNRTIATQQKRVYDKLLRHSVSYFAEKESSGLLLRVTEGAKAARQLIDVILTGFIRDTLTLVGLVVVMIYQQPVLSVMFLVVGPLALLSVRFLVRSIRQIMQAEIKSMAEIIRVLQETSIGIRVIKGYALEGTMRERMQVAISQVEQRSNDIAQRQSIASPAMEFLSGLAIAGVLLVSTVGIAGQEPPTAGQLMSFITALMMSYEPAKRLSRMRVQIETCMVGVGMLFEILDEEETMRENPNAQALPAGSGEITLQNVAFGYNGSTRIMEGMSLTIEAQKTTALIGQSGGGKSTLFGLLLRFYDPDEGHVRIDGTDIRDVSFSALRRDISYVGQETFLFSTSVMENLRCAAPEASDKDVFAAARFAHAHDFICALPQGYYTQVGENGAFLSGGQRQRLAIARAILRKPRILLLDEVTSALDAESETLVKEALNTLTNDVTIVVIAHRLSTILEADRVIVLQDGAIVEDGPPDALLAQEGHFRHLFDQQFQHTSRTRAQNQALV